MYQDKSEEFVIESEAKFRSAFDYAAIGMALVGLEGSWLEVNQALCETLGYSEPELLGLTFQDITHPADLEADLGCVQQLLAGEIRSYQIEKRYIHKQGQEVWVLLSVSLLQDANGQPLYFVSQIQNISQRKRVENNLRLQSTIVRNIAEGVCMLRAADGVIVYANPKFGQMFGYEPGELIDQHVSILNYPDVDEGSVESAERIMAEIHRQGEYTYEVHNIHKDRSDFWCRATTSVFEHPEYGCVYVAVQSDITQEKRAAAEIRLLQSLTLAISAAEDFDAALNLILQQVSETYGWIYGEAWIPNLEENVLHCSPAFYSCAKHQKGCCALAPLSQFRSLSETFTFALGQGLPGRVWRSKQAEWQTDVSMQPEAVFLRHSIAAEYGIKASLGIPIVTSQGEVLAVLVFFRQEATRSDPQMIDSLSAIAAQLNLLMQRKRAEAALYREKELAQVTLESIGDGVITTDAQGQVDYLNPVAQVLTGWHLEAARGLPFREIFQIFNQSTRQPVDNPIEQALREKRTVALAPNTVLINRQGREIAIDDSAAPICTAAGEVLGGVMVFHDVTQSRTLSQQLSWQASHDPLTRLINRREFDCCLESVVSQAQLHEQSHALCCLDLDRFKTVNDTCGHAAGDELLRQVTALMQRQIRKTDTLARLGGDEFGLILHHCPPSRAVRIASSLCEKVQAFRFVWQGQSFGIGVSIGLAIVDAECESAQQVMVQADTACYGAKRGGRSRVHYYRSNDTGLVQAHG